MTTAIIPPQVREDFYIDTWFDWCLSVTTNNQELQKVMANPAIARWFSIEYAKCEAEFETRTKNYIGHVANNDLLNCYADCTLRLFNIRPMPLINEAKRRKGPKGIQVITPNPIYYAN